jgi:hypothetical protein
LSDFIRAVHLLNRHIHGLPALFPNRLSNIVYRVQRYKTHIAGNPKNTRNHSFQCNRFISQYLAKYPKHPVRSVYLREILNPVVQPIVFHRTDPDHPVGKTHVRPRRLQQHPYPADCEACTVDNRFFQSLFTCKTEKEAELKY